MNREEIIKKITGNNKTILDLGDTKKSRLYKSLNKKNKITTIILNKKADIKWDLEKGLPKRIHKKKYDVIIAGEIFEHIFNLDKLLKDIKKVMKTKSKLIVSVPNNNNLIDRFKVLIGRLPTFCAHANDFEERGHVRDFNKKEITKKLKKNGFKIKKYHKSGLIHNQKTIIPASLCPTSLGTFIILTATKN